MRRLLMVVFLVQGLALSQAGNGVIAGRIRLADGSEIAGRRIMVSAKIGPATSRTVGAVQTDSAGNYRMDNVPPGDYYISANSLDTADGYFPGVSNFANATAITVKAGATVVGIDFTVETRIQRPVASTSSSGPGVKVTGRVLLAQGRPSASQGAVTIQGLALVSSTAQIRTDGTFEFSGILPGNYIAAYQAENVIATQQIIVANADLTGVELVDSDLVRNSTGLTKVWSVDGKYNDAVWDSAGGVLHAAIGTTLVDLDRTGKVLKQVPFPDNPVLRLAYFANQGTVLLSYSRGSPNVDAYDLAGKQVWRYVGDSLADVWVKDLDGDGSDEVIVGLLVRGGGLHVLDSTGKLLWQASIANVYNVEAADVRGEGKPQVIVSAAGQQIVIVGSDGKQRTSLRPGFSATLIRTGKISASDPAETIFVAGTGTTGSPILLALSGDGTKKWSLELTGARYIYSASLAPGKPWLAVGMQGGQVDVVDVAYGTIIASIDGQGGLPGMTWMSVKDSETPLLVISTGSKLSAYRVK